MSALKPLRSYHGDVPSARQHNAVLAHLLANRVLQPIVVVNDPAPHPHPWRVSASRFEKNDRSTLDPASTWRIDIGDGFINDQPATILYQRTGDPRGWLLPQGYVEIASPDPRWVERDALDDPDDPPFLAILDPPINHPPSTLNTSSPWTNVPDAQRPNIEHGAFCGASDWELELWRAHVILSATPFAATFFSAAIPPPRLVKYRLYTLPALPAPSYGSQAGGWVELATLYLLRDAKDPHGTAEVRVRQREFYDDWAMTVQPGADLLGIFSDAGSGALGPDFANLLQAQLEDTLSSTTETLFWSV